jgi:hypothetical protein
MMFCKFMSLLYSGGSQSVVCDPHKGCSGDPQNCVFFLEVTGTALNVFLMFYICSNGVTHTQTHTHARGIPPLSVAEYCIRGPLEVE